MEAFETFRFSEIEVGTCFYFPYVSKAPRHMKSGQKWIKESTSQAFWITPGGSKAIIRPSADWQVCKALAAALGQEQEEE